MIKRKQLRLRNWLMSKKTADEEKLMVKKRRPLPQKR